MVFTAKIISSKRVKDNAEMVVKFTNGEENFTKIYKYPKLEDIDNTFSKTVKAEVDRINILDNENYEELKSKVEKLEELKSILK